MRRISNIANIRSALGPRKPLVFIGSSLRDLRDLPAAVRTEFGRALLDVQYGETPEAALPFGEGIPGVMKLVDDHRGDTYRAAYTVELPKAVYVLHVFQKKSKHGIGTPRHDIERIRARLRQARAHHG